MPCAPPVMIATLSLSRIASSRGACPQRSSDGSEQHAIHHARGAAARPSRSLIARPSPCCGIGIAAIRTSPSAVALVVQHPQTGEQPGGGFRQIAAVAQREHRPGSSQCRTEREQPLVAPHIDRIQPQGQPWCIVRCEQPRRPQRARLQLDGGAYWSDHRTRSPPPSRRQAAATPGRRLRHRARLISTPTMHGPLSSTAAMAPASSANTCRAAVGLTRPERLADGAATGRPNSRSNARAVSCAGTRTATVSSPALASRLTAQPRSRGSTRLSGPGQNAAANRRASAFATTSANAVSASA